MKTCVLTFVAALTLFGCNPGPKADSVSDDPETEQMGMVDDTLISYAQPEFDTVKSTYIVPVGNDSHVLEVSTYALNDSSFLWINDSDQDKIHKVIYHNNASEIRLTYQNDTLFNMTLDKEIFRDSLPAEFYERSVIWNIEYKFVRSNRLYFTVNLVVPDTDWMMTGDMAVFYRTSKKGQIDYWNFKEE